MSTDKKSKKLPTAKQYREAARRLHHAYGECEVDGNARVSRDHGPDEEGAYVQAWVWVPREDVDETFPTFCGSMTRAEIAEHIKECKVCADDAEKRADL